MAENRDDATINSNARLRRVSSAMLHEKMAYLLHPQEKPPFSPKNSSSHLDWAENSARSNEEAYTQSDFIWGKQYAALRNQERNPFVQSQFQRNYEENESLAATAAVYTLFTVIMIPTFAELTSHDDNAGQKIYKGVVACSVGMITLIISMWLSFYYQFNRYKRLDVGYFMDLLKSLYPKMRVYSVLGITSVFILRLFLRAYTGQCHGKASSTYPGGLNCNPETGTSGLPKESVVGLMMLPILFTLTMREVNIKVILLSWGSIIISLFIVIVGIAEDRTFLPMVVIYILPSLAMIFENYRYNRSLFLVTVALRKSLKDRDDNADQMHATEMRHMIANVAHDLKTPLTSFLSGIEVIGGIIADCQKRLNDNVLTTQTLQENIFSVLNCLTNIRSTNSFMLMTINRCIDYTKASKGLKLVPKYETIDLLETLSLPLHCMKDIQSRMEIRLEKIPKEICSHVITDKQWLQENVLCLLSNAVKYSNEGMVTVTLHLIKGDDELAKIRLKPTQSPRPDSSDLSKVYPSSSLIADAEEGGGLRDSPSPSPTPHQISVTPEKKSPDSNAPYKGDLIRIEIEDNGIGLSEEAMSTLFNPFKQAQRLAGGTGLGLYSLARRVEALSGYYGVENRRDGEQGCMFWFSIPYRPDKVSAGSLRGSIFPRHKTDAIFTAVTEAKNAANDSSLKSPPVPGGSTPENTVAITSVSLDEQGRRPSDSGGLENKSNTLISDSSIASPSSGLPDSSVKLDILIVDDSPTIVKMTSIMLKRLGHSITIAENGDAALKKIWERLEECRLPFDVVLMDLQMPVMDGLEATRRLRSFEHSLVFTTSSKESMMSNNQNQRRTLGLGKRSSLETSDRSYSSVDGSVTGGGQQLHQCVIGVSANSDYETMQDAIGAGVDAFMAKPFSIETFYDTYEALKARKM